MGPGQLGVTSQPPRVPTALRHRHGRVCAQGKREFALRTYDDPLGFSHTRSPDAQIDPKERPRVKRFVRAIDAVNSAVTTLVGALLAIMAAAVMVQVLVRFVLTAAGVNISAPWTEELARYVLIWMVFLGAAVGVRHARMIALEFGVRSLPPGAGIPLRYAVTIFGIAFFGLLFWVGLDFVELGRTETSPVLGITRDWVYWAMPVGMALMIVNSLALIAETLAERRDIRFAADHAPQDGLS